LKWAKIGKAFTGCSDRLSKTTGRGRTSRERQLAARESRDGVTKQLPKKKKWFCFWPEFLVFRAVTA
tara:strand:+ start:772 stop:972 length:201 start_codon:yes stop_codon:yes gene_type:complete